MSTTINKNIFDITTLHNGSSVDVVTMGVTSSGQPELDIGSAALVNDSSDNLKLNGQDILTRGQVDNAPTENSTNLVTSGGVYTALQDTENNAVQKIASTYNATVAYAINDLVSYEGKLYICIHQSTGNLPTNTTYFKETTVGETLDDVYVKQKAYYSTLGAGYADQAKELYSDRQIENPEVACPPITFGVAGGEAEIQSGLNKFEFLYGNSKVWNQLLNPNDYENTVTKGGITFTKNADGSITLSGSNTSGSNVVYTLVPSISKSIMVNNHKYLLSGGSWTKNMILRFSGVSGNIQTTNGKPVIGTGNESNYVGRTAYLQVGSGTSFSEPFTIYPMWIDLTAMNYPMAGLTNAQIIANFKKDYPLDYYEYNAGTILSAKSASLISRMKNQCSGLNQFIRVLPNTEYELSGITAGGYIEEYDANKNLILTSSEITDTTDITLTANTYYVKIQATTYSDVMFYDTFADNGPGSGVYGESYVPYEEDTIGLPNIELRSVPNYTTGGEIRDEAYQVGGGKRYVSIVADLSTLTWTYANDTQSWESQAIGGIKSISSSSTKANLLASNYITTTRSSIASSVGGICQNTANQIVINNGSTTIKPTGILVYELATPTDIPTTENSGWRGNVEVDNFGTLEFTNSDNQIPQVEQPYFIKYTINLVEWLDTAYVATGGNATILTPATQDEIDEILAILQ